MTDDNPRLTIGDVLSSIYGALAADPYEAADRVRAALKDAGFALIRTEAEQPGASLVLMTGVDLTRPPEGWTRQGPGLYVRMITADELDRATVT